MVELERPVVQGRDVGVDVRVLAERRDALAFVGMAEVRHDDLHVGEPDGDGIEVPRERAFQRGLGDERRARVQQHRESVLRGVVPERVEPLRRRGGTPRTSAAA